MPRPRSAPIGLFPRPEQKYDPNEEGQYRLSVQQAIQTAVGTLTEKVGTLAGEIFDKGGAVYNVMHPDFGAKGDGTTDDATAIQLALTQANTDSGGSVYLPTGTYKIGVTLNIGTNVALIGAGIGRTTIKLADISSQVDLLKNLDTTNGNSRIRIAEMTLDGNRTDNSGVNGIAGIEMFKVTFCVFQNIRITGVTQHGLELEDRSTDNLINGIWVDDYGTSSVGFGIVLIRGAKRNRVTGCNIVSTNTNIGIAIDDFSSSGDSLDSTYNIIDGNYIQGMDEGVLIEGCTLNKVVNNNIDNVTNIGIRLNRGTTGDNSRSNINPERNIISCNTIISPTAECIEIERGIRSIIVNNYCEGGTHGVSVTSSTTDLLIQGNTFYNNSVNGIRISRCSRIRILDNEIDTSGGIGLYMESTTLASLSRISVIGNMFDTIDEEAIWIERHTDKSAARFLIQSNYILDCSVASTGTDAVLATNGAVDSLNVFDNILASGSNALGLFNISGITTSFYARNNRIDDAAITTLVDDATPSISENDVFITGGTANDPITDFDDGFEGKIIMIIAEHSVVITNGTNIFLNGSGNFTMAATDTLTLIQKADGRWYELARSVN